MEETTDRSVLLHAWIRTTLRPHVAPIIRDDSRYRFVFDQLEFLLALGYTHVFPDYGWAPIGSLGSRNRNVHRIVEEIEASFASRRDDSPFVKSGIFGDTVALCRERLEALQQLIAKVR